MSDGLTRYGCQFKSHDPVAIERYCILRGGKWLMGDTLCGAGLYEHYKSLISSIWPFYVWHRWNELMLKEYLEHKETILLGPASTGKSNFMAIMALVEFWIMPEATSCLVSSTTIEGLERRILGEIKKYFRKARERRPDLPGNPLDARHAIVNESVENDEVRDIRSGIIGIACRIGGKDVGLSNYVGVKNKRVRLFADEGAYMSLGFVQGANNLDANEDFKMVVAGNPNDPTDALGILAEPAPSEGGWEGVEQGEKTRTWRTRRANAICIQLVGTDSPNFDEPHGRFPYLIGRKKIEDTRQNYGDNTRDFCREAKGHMLIGGARRRVITRDLCEKHGAFNEPFYSDVSKVRTVVGLDAAYAAVGGDRTVLVELSFGPGTDGKFIMAPKEPVVVPVRNVRNDPPEDQIARYVKEYCERRSIPPEDFSCDGTGRSSLVSALARIWSPSITAIEFGGKATDRPLGPITKCSDKFDRFVTELWFSVRHIVEHDQFRGMTESILEEGQAREWDEKVGGVYSIKNKQQVKLALGMSPDIFDALVCAVELARRKGFRFESTQMLRTNRNPEWFRKMIERRKQLAREHELVFSA